MIRLIWHPIVGVISAIALIVIVVFHLISRLWELSVGKLLPDDLDTPLILYRDHPKCKTLRWKIQYYVITPLSHTLQFLIELPIYMAWPIVRYSIDLKIIPRSIGLPRVEDREFAVTQDDLLQPISIEKIEELERVFDPMGAAPDLPFGHLNAAWHRFLLNLEPGDVIWTFSARWDVGFRRKEIRAGYVILRDSSIGPYFLALVSRVNYHG